MKFCGSTVVVLVAALSGCTLTQGGSSDAGTGQDDGVDVRSDGPPIVDSGPDVTPEVTCKLGADVVTIDKCPGERCLAGDCAYFKSCSEMHAGRPALPTGLHQFAAPLGFAYCDMDTDKGGWTLVGRSVAATVLPVTGFGWLKAAGDPSQDTKPYSLDMTKYPGSPTEALVGVYTSAKTWGAPVYKITLPVAFPAGYGISSVGVTGSAVVQSGCGAALATDLGFVGYTSSATTFYFDPTGAPGVLGLSWSGFLLGGVANCAANGEMDSKQGQIFVR